MPKQLDIVRLHATAFLFTEDPTLTVKQLAKRLQVNEGTIYGWAKRKEWEDALDTLGFEGPRKFASKQKRNLERDSGALVDLARETYLRARKDGMRKTAANEHTAKVINMSASTIEKWKRRYNWEGSTV